MGKWGNPEKPADEKLLNPKFSELKISASCLREKVLYMIPRKLDKKNSIGAG